MKHLLIAFLLLAIAAPAHARVEMPAKAVMTMGFGNATEFADGHKWNANSLTAAQAEAAALKQIEDAYAMGVRVFFYDAASTNSAAHVWRISRWNIAARSFNAAHTSDKICFSPMYEESAAGNGTSDGALPMFDAADAGGAASPLCTIGGKPVIATWGSNICVNPLPHLSARGPFAVVATTFNNGTNIMDSACVTALKNAGASTVKSYIWASGNSAFSDATTVSNKKAAIEATGTGVEFVMGIGNARAEACGDGGNGPKSSDYRLTDLKYWFHYLEGWRLAIANNVNYAMLTMSSAGDLGENSYITSALVCDPRDAVNHSAESAGITRGFSCPNVPDDFKAAVPAGFHKSTSLPLWTRRGFHRAQQVFSEWLRTGTEPAADKPFIAYAYRQHKWGLTGTWAVCPSGQYVITPASIGGVHQGDHIALTSWLSVPTRVQVELAGAVIYDGTLPAKQMKLTGDSKQVLVPIGNRVGRPIIKAIGEDGTVIASSEGLLKITTTPKHWGNKAGRNPGLYADYFDIAPGANRTSGIALGATGAIKNNVVRSINGSGLYTFGAATNVDIVHNTVRTTKSGIVVGSDAGSGNGKSMAIVSNIVADSSSSIKRYGDIDADAIYSNNLLYNNTTQAQDLTEIEDTGTIQQDPLFVSATDSHIATNSPARDAGLSEYSTGVDIVGQARDAEPDIGAYEFYDPSTRPACTASAIEPCDVGGASYPCSTVTASTCPAVPTLQTPTNITVPESGGSYTLSADEDAYITASGIVRNTVSVHGGRNVHVKGLEIILDWPANAALNVRALALYGMQAAYVEGSLIDANDRCDSVTVASESELLSYDTAETKLTLVNTYIANANSGRLNGACVGDCLQIQGEGSSGTVDIDVHNGTCIAKANGYTVPDRQLGGDNSVALTNVNVRPGADGVPRYSAADGIYYYFWQSGDNQNAPYELENVWSDWAQSNRNVSPGPATSTQQYVDFTDQSRVLFRNTKITGFINRGIPPSGDFAPRSKVGTNYNRSEFCTN